MTKFADRPGLARTRPLAHVLLVLNGLALVVASWTPGNYMVRTHVISGLAEHFAAYFLSGLLASAVVSERLRVWQVTCLLAVYAGILEVCQIFVPGRNAAFIDFAASALGAGAGVATFMIVSRRLLGSKQLG